MKKTNKYGGLTTLMLQETERMMQRRIKEVFGEIGTLRLFYDISYDEYTIDVRPWGIPTPKGKPQLIKCDAPTLNDCWKFIIEICIEERTRQNETGNKQTTDFIC